MTADNNLGRDDPVVRSGDNPNIVHAHIETPGGIYSKNELPTQTEDGRHIEWDFIEATPETGGTQADLTGHVIQGSQG